MTCSHDPMDGLQYYYRISSRRVRDKEVQVIPWALSDSNSIRCPSPRLDPGRTVFVGGLHGLLNAGESVCLSVGRWPFCVDCMVCWGEVFGGSELGNIYLFILSLS